MKIKPKKWLKKPLGEKITDIGKGAKALKESGLIDNLQARHQESKTPASAFKADNIKADDLAVAGAKQFVTLDQKLSDDEIALRKRIDALK